MAKLILPLEDAPNWLVKVVAVELTDWRVHDKVNALAVASIATTISRANGGYNYSGVKSVIGQLSHVDTTIVEAMTKVTDAKAVLFPKPRPKQMELFS